MFLFLDPALESLAFVLSGECGNPSPTRASAVDLQHQHESHIKLQRSVNDAIRSYLIRNSIKLDEMMYRRNYKGLALQQFRGGVQILNIFFYIMVTDVRKSELLVALLHFWNNFIKIVGTHGY